MDITADLEAPCEPAALHVWIDDLSRYPEWLGIVPRAVPDPPVDGDPGPAWVIHLRGKVGPLTRSKRLRMVRSSVSPAEVVFERREVDGQQHSSWVLRAALASIDDGTRLTMRLHYDGRLWEPLVERLLRDEIAQSRARLLALLG
jgi:hypothetical protein